MKDVTDSLNQEVFDVVEIQSNLIPMLISEDEDLELELIDGSYHIKIFNEVKSLLENYIERVDNYIYSDEDRQFIKKLKAQANKQQKFVNDKVKEQTNNLFNTTIEERDELKRLLETLSTKLAIGLKAEDERKQAEKRELILEKFEEAKSAYVELKDQPFTLEDIEAKSWLNISMSLNKVYTDLNDRLVSIKEMLVNPTNPTDDVQITITKLNQFNWNALAALNDLIREENERVQEEMRKELDKQIQLREESLKPSSDGGDVVSVKKAPLPKVLVRIDGEDWERAKTLLDASGIKYFKV